MDSDKRTHLNVDWFKDHTPFLGYADNHRKFAFVERMGLNLINTLKSVKPTDLKTRTFHPF